MLFEGGLPIGRRSDGLYIVGAPPRIRIIERVDDYVTIDDLRVPLDGGDVIQIPTTLEGSVNIRYGEDSLSIELRRVPESENADCGDLGWAIDVSGVMNLVDADEQENPVLIGAELRT
jgi:hypothetical protein